MCICYLSANALALIGFATLATAQPQEEHHLFPGELSSRDRQFQDCARVCRDCMTRCEENYEHCARLVADGKKECLGSMVLSRDCADLCAVAGRLCARQSPLATEACAACARACDQCAAECEKHDSSGMEACAKVCRECARVCRDMVKQVAEAR
jgi:Domain of Unknown Function (DUF326)